MKTRLLLLLPLLFVTGAFAQDFGLPALPGATTERSKLTTSLPLLDAASVASLQVTRRTTDGSLQQVRQLIGNVRTQLDQLAQAGDEPGAREKQADLTTTLDVAREAERHFQDAIQLLDDRSKLEEDKRRANADRMRRLEDDANAEKRIAAEAGKTYTLEQSDQQKAALAEAQNRQSVVRAKLDSLKSDEEGLERQATEAASVLSRREAELGEVREKLAQERHRAATPDELTHLQKFARLSELRRQQARDRVAYIESLRAFLGEKRATLEFQADTDRLEVATLRRLAEFISDRATVSQEDIESRGVKLLEQEQERQKRIAAGEAEARKADGERAAAVEKKAQAEDEVAHPKRGTDREAARARFELAQLAIDEAEARKACAETRIALAQAEFDRERERTGYYGLIRDIRANTVSNTELQERRREVRTALASTSGKLEAAERQAEEGRAARRVLESQVAALTAKLSGLDLADKALSTRVRDQQRALTRVFELREERIALLMSLGSTLGETKRLLSDLERRLDRELGISRIWERKTSALSPDGLKHAAADVEELQTGIEGTAAYLSAHGVELAREAFSLQNLTLGVLTLLFAYLDLALVLWARRRLAIAGQSQLDAVRDPRHALVRVAHRAVPWVGLLGISLLVAGWMPLTFTGLAVTLTGSITVAVAIHALLDELLAPWADDARLISCSAAVARHVYGHLRRILILSAIVVPVIHALPYVFVALSRPPHAGLSDLLWAVYKLLMVVQILLLAYPRELVMSLLPQSGSRLATMGTSTVRALYPVLTAFVLSLFALGAVGYVDLARFLWVSTLQTLLAVSAAWGAQFLLRVSLHAVLVGDRELPPDVDPSEEHLAAVALVTGTTRLARYALAVAVVVGLWFIWGGDPEGLHTLHKYGRAQMSFGPFLLSPYAVAAAILTLYVSLLASRYLVRFLEVAVYPTTDFDTGIRYAVSTAVHYFVMALGLSYALETMGIGMEYVKWFVGAIGVGAGFGLQNIVYNIISGVIVLIERPVKLGDWIEVGGTRGRVEKISIRSTTVCDADDIEVIIPNAELVSQKVSNWTHTNTVTKIRTIVRVAYGTDTDVMRRLLIDVAKSNPNVLQNPPPQALLHQFGEKALEFELAVAVRDPATRTVTLSDLNIAIEKALRKARIAIPHNVQHVWEPGAQPPLEMRK